MKKAQAIWSLFVVILTLAVVWLVWSHLKTYLANDHKVVQARDAQRRLFEVAVAMQDVEASARGYLLTSNEHFLNKYQEARQKVEPRLNMARVAAAGIDLTDPFDLARALIFERLSLLEKMISSLSAGQRTEAVASLDSEPVLQNGASMRQAMLDLLGATDDCLQERLRICRASTVSMTNWVLVGVGALVVSSTALLWLLWRDNRRQRRTVIELAAARDAAVAGTRARDEFLNVLSHELRTPLTPALACVSMLERQAPRGSEQAEDLLMVRRQLELEARLIDDLLNMGMVLRRELKLRPKPVAMHELIRHIIDACREVIEEKNLALQTHFEATEDRVSGDESRLHVALWHIITNAAKFTPNGGSIDIRTVNTPGQIVITVTDSGIGFGPETLAHIFEPFHQADSSLTRRFGGLGMGLAITKPVIELHGGTLTAGSEGKDKGAVFTLTLPLEQAARA